MNIFLLLCALAAHASPVDDERITNEFKISFLKGGKLIPGIEGAQRSKLALDALESLIDAKKKLNLSKAIPFFAWPQFEPRERVRWFRISGAVKEKELVDSLKEAPATSGLLYEVLSAGLSGPLLTRLEKALPAEAASWRVSHARGFTPPGATALRSLFTDLPDLAHYQNGAFAGHPRLFLFCRHNRNYSCLLALKDKDDHVVRNGNSPWTQKGLGLSGYGKPFDQSYGNTPQGVHEINSVMPEANDPESYGRFRRMILEFPASSTGDAEMKRLLPATALTTDWWKESAIARDVGRGELRIHGTGQHNDRPDVLFYPFIATIGCVAQLEMEYDGVNYIDQRHLLDKIMTAQGLTASFDNEPKIKALLYVIDIDDKAAPVTLADLAGYGIN